MFVPALHHGTRVASLVDTMPGAESPEDRYEPHDPAQTLLHRVVREQLETFLAHARARERPAPRFIEQELRAFVRCGILAHGFLRLRCDDCGHDRLVPFSCKRRGFCPSCGGRRMADTAAHLVDRVLPAVPIRQWVLTLPYPLRYRCAYDRSLTSDVLRAYLRALFAELRRRVRRRWGVRAEQCGAVTFLQRFGSALNLNLHFHTLALDGAYPYPETYDDAPRFWPLPPPTPGEVARALAGTARRIERLLVSRAEEEDDALAREEPLLAALAAASLRSCIAEGYALGEPWRRFGDRVDPGDPLADPDAPPRVAECRGMTLHAAVAVPARDRRRLERLCRYVARPPLAIDRLEERPDGVLLLRLKARWRDGTTHIAMEKSELIDPLGAADPAAARPPGALPRHPRAVREPAQPGGAGAGDRPGRCGCRRKRGGSRCSLRSVRVRHPRGGRRRRGSIPHSAPATSLGRASAARLRPRRSALPSLRGDAAPRRRDRGSGDRAAHPRVHRASRAGASARRLSVGRSVHSVGRAR